ncbi:MAG: NAD(+)/NADH kinase [Thermoleophilia bacterium]
MPKPLRRIVVRTHHFSAAADTALQELCALAHEHELELLVSPAEVQKHPQLAGLNVQVVDDTDARAADLCLVFGGDGTVLRSLGHFLGSEVPTLGVNFGNVGFLAALPRHNWAQRLPAVLAGDYRVVELLTVAVHHDGQTFTGVNDVVISRVGGRHVLQLEYEVAGMAVGTMSCDGLIVASPAGSTAYNLSCSGPIVEWTASVLVLNFIAPHSLAFRPVVVQPDHAIVARNISPSQEAELVVDGEAVGMLGRDAAVSIAAGSVRARLLITAETSFYENVERKLFDRRRAR